MRRPLDYELLVQVMEGSGYSRRVTFTFFERDIQRLEKLANGLNINKSVLLRYLIAELERQVEGGS